jgi:1-acyl-sn-glycerol-3-phosphate acyltransferase
MTVAYRPSLGARAARAIMRPVFRAIFHILARVEIHGLENIPRGQAYVAAINHISLYDPPFMLSFWPEWLEVMGAVDIWNKPGQNLLARMYGGIPVHRGRYDRQALERVLAALNSGRALLIAPEGGRSHAVAMRRAKPGIAYVVDQAKVPVVPVGLVGTTDDFWQQASRGKRPLLEMHVGRPVQLPPLEESDASERREARQRNADLVMAHIAGLLPEPYRGVYADQAILPQS